MVTEFWLGVLRLVFGILIAWPFVLLFETFWTWVLKPDKKTPKIKLNPLDKVYENVRVHELHKYERLLEILHKERMDRIKKNWDFDKPDPTRTYYMHGFFNREDPKRHERIYFDTKQEAQEILGKVFDILNRYGNVSVGDYYDLVGKRATDYDMKIGWTNLDDTIVVRLSKGFVITFSYPKNLE